MHDDLRIQVAATLIAAQYGPMPDNVLRTVMRTALKHADALIEVNRELEDEKRRAVNAQIARSVAAEAAQRR